MKWAILSDIHSNIEAFRECLDRLEEVGYDKLISLGDIVGYNADPNECVDIVRERDVLSIMGNHDVCAAGLREPVDFNPIARDAILWTRRVFSAPENNHFLTVLPDARRVDDKFLMVHGAVTHRDNYIFNEFDARESFELLLEKHPDIQRLLLRAYASRHHLPARRARGSKRPKSRKSSRSSCDRDVRYLINPGSVGQPRDGDPRASFVVFDDANLTLTYYRVDYDVPKSSRKVVSAGLPPQLGQRLLLGI